MASLNLYKEYAKADIKNKYGGYKPQIWFAPVNTFTSIKTPTGSPTALGDTLKITTSHTFPADEGFIPMLCKQHSVTTTSAPVGDDGSVRSEWTLKAIFLGDSAELMETLEGMQAYSDSIFLAKDQDCLNATDYVQIGDECQQGTVKYTFTGNTTKEGLKEYALEVKVTGKKFFYSGTVTEKP